MRWIGWMAWSAAISWIVLRPLIASMATLALNSGLWVRRLLIGGSPDQGRCPASEVNDVACPEKPVHIIGHDVRLRSLLSDFLIELCEIKNHANPVSSDLQFTCYDFINYLLLI